MSLAISTETDFLLDLVNQAYISQYQTVYNSLTTKPSASIAAAQNTMVSSLVNGGVWTKFDAFYMFAQTTNGGSEALINWVNPGTYDCTLVGAPTFTALEGFTGADGKYINTNFVPSTDGVNYALDDASIGYYSRTDNGGGVNIGGGQAHNNDGTNIWAKFSGSVYVRINADDHDLDTATSASGMFVGTRDANNNVDLYRNNSVLVAGTAASTVVPAYSIYIHANNSSDSPLFPSTDQISMAFVGSSLSSAEITILTDAFEVYMDSNSKGVIT